MTTLLHDYTDRLNMPADTSAGIFHHTDGRGRDHYTFAWGFAYDVTQEHGGGAWVQGNTAESGAESFDTERAAVEYADSVAAALVTE